MYTIVYHDVLEQSDLKADEYILLDIFNKEYNLNKDEEGFAEPGKVQLAKTLNKSYMAIYNIFNRLVEDGWLEERKVNKDNIKYKPTKKMIQTIVKDRIEIYAQKSMDTTKIIEVIRKEHQV